MKAYSPTGKLIVATLDRVPGAAMISDDSFIKRPDGSVDFDYEGDTKIFWDDQKTVRRARMTPAGLEPETPERVFLDEDCKEWLESDLKLVEDNDP